MAKSARLFELAQAYLDEVATPAMLQELSELLLSDRRARQQFALIVSLHRRLYNHYRVDDMLQLASGDEEHGTVTPSDSQLRLAMADLLAAEEAALARVVPIQEHPADTADASREMSLQFNTLARQGLTGRPAPRVIVIPRVLVYGVSIAAAVALSLLLWAFLPERPVHRTADPIAQQPADGRSATEPAFYATVIDVAHLDGVGSVSSYAIGDRLEGELELGREVIEARLSTGVHVVLTGPFKGRMLGPDRLFLDQGEVVIDVTESSGGYVVSTATSDYRDLGTVFAVSQVKAGISEVFVLQGEVLATRQGANGTAEQQSLHAGQSARVAADGGGIEVHDRFDRPFSRSARDARRAFRQQEIERQTIAYWSFEPQSVPVQPFPYSLLERPLPAVLDISGRANHLYLFDGEDHPYIASGHGPQQTVGWNARPNTRAVYIPVSTYEIDNTNDLFTWPPVTTASPGYDLTVPDWDQWTIELSFSPDRLEGRQTVLGMDGEVRMGDEVMPIFACSLVEGQLVVSCIDSTSVLREIACQLPVREARWMHLALVYDGEMLKLLAKSSDTAGYQFCGQVPLVGGLKVPGPRSVDGKPQIWTLGRGMDNGRYSNMFNGYIDEVRFCRLALQAEELLFSERPDAE